MSKPGGEAAAHLARPWRPVFLQGFRDAPSTAAFVLISSFVGFGALAHESGLSVVEALYMSAFVWALPGQVVLASEMAHGAALWSATLAVTLTAVRLFPLTVVLMPLLRGERTSKLHQILLAHFCAVTVWVESMHRLPRLPRAERVPYYWGFVAFLIPANVVAALVGHLSAAALGGVVAAVLLFLTPLYFALSMYRASQQLADRLALLFGFLLGPLVYVAAPGFELVLSGLAGGTAAYLVGRARRRAGA